MAVKENWADGNVLYSADLNTLGAQINLNDGRIKSITTSTLEQELRILLLEQDASLTSPEASAIQADVFSDADGYANTVDTGTTTASYDTGNDYYLNLQYYDDITGQSETPWETDSETNTSSGAPTSTHTFSEPGDGDVTVSERSTWSEVEADVAHTQNRVWGMESGEIFTIDDLPLAITLTATTSVLCGPNSEVSSSDSGTYEFEKKDANTIKWRKDGGAYTDIDATAWTKTTLEFRGTNNSTSSFTNSTDASSGAATNKLEIGDGTNYSEIFSSTSSDSRAGTSTAGHAYSDTAITFFGLAKDLILVSGILNDSGDSVNKEQVAVMFEGEIETDAGEIGVQVSTDGGSNWTTETTTFIESGTYTHTGWLPITTQGTDVRVKLNLNAGTDLIKKITISKYSIAWYPGG